MVNRREFLGACTSWGVGWGLLRGAARGKADKNDPWTAEQLVSAEQLGRELSVKKARPTMLCVGVRTLFEGGHVPGARFHGTASTQAGMATLKAWAEPLPRHSNLVIYCGCCPFEKCPNIRPAFTTLREMGFTQLRVLLLPKNFAADWAEKGYAIEKGL